MISGGATDAHACCSRGAAARARAPSAHAPSGRRRRAPSPDPQPPAGAGTPRVKHKWRDACTSLSLARARLMLMVRRDASAPHGRGAFAAAAGRRQVHASARSCAGSCARRCSALQHPVPAGAASAITGHACSCAREVTLQCSHEPVAHRAAIATTWDCGCPTSARSSSSCRFPACAEDNDTARGSVRSAPPRATLPDPAPLRRAVLRAALVDERAAALLFELRLGEPQLLHAAQRRQDGAADPHAVLALHLRTRGWQCRRAPPLGNGSLRGLRARA